MEISGVKVTIGTIVVAVVSMAIGAYVNYKVNQKSDKELFDKIKAELDSLKAKQKVSRVSAEDRNKITQLEGALTVLEKKIN